MSIRVVYDTMIFLQAASRPHRTHATFQAIADGRVTLCLSAELLAEVQDVLNRDNIRTKFPALTRDTVHLFIGDLLTRGVLFKPAPPAFTWPQHPDDDHVFNLAIQASAEYLVTWESRLLNFATQTTPVAGLLRRLAPNLTICTPVAMMQSLEKTNALK